MEKNASGIDESASCKSLASGSGVRLALGPSQPVARASTPSVNVEGGGSGDRFAQGQKTTPGTV